VSRRNDAADLARAHVRLAAVTHWIAARPGAILPDTATLQAAAEIIATPPTIRDTWTEVRLASVHSVNGHLVVLYRERDDRRSPVVDGRCSCDRPDAVCEHLLVALAGEKLQ
jgi:hypothetical protein